jgi:hypothetical protein
MLQKLPCAYSMLERCDLLVNWKKTVGNGYAICIYFQLFLFFDLFELNYPLLSVKYNSYTKCMCVLLKDLEPIIYLVVSSPVFLNKSESFLVVPELGTEI